MDNFLPYYSRTFAGMGDKIKEDKKKPDRFDVRLKEDERADFDKAKEHMRAASDAETFRRLVYFYNEKNGVK